MRGPRGKFYFYLSAIDIGVVVFRFLQDLGDVWIGRYRIVVIIVGDDVVVIVVVKIYRVIVNIYRVVIIDNDIVQIIIDNDIVQIIGFHFRSPLRRGRFSLACCRRPRPARTNQCERIQFRAAFRTNDRIALHIVKARGTPEAGALQTPFRIRQKQSPSNSVNGREPLPCSAGSVKSKITPCLRPARIMVETGLVNEQLYGASRAFRMTP